MADNLIFPIKFDLEAAVREAQGDADRLLRRLQATINAKPLAVNLKIPGAGSGSINEINSRLKELVKQWNSLTEAQRITNKTTGEYTAEAKKILAEYTRLRGASESYAQSLKQIDSAAKKAAKQQEKLSEAAYRGSNAFKNQDGYVSRLVKRLAVYASFQYTSQFLTNIREVTAQFELQRISLGAIIQDQQKANQIFAEIKSFALTSPLKILDLTKYAKQVAAYGFAADRVFDVTKRLADISIGLGVDMGRLTLAVSQIKAATVLKSSELRQLTETGLPMLDLLSKKLTETQGKLVSAADVMDLISKRAISYEMVEEILYDLTDAGGMFYNMQVKQSQTLFGMWSKLGDAAAIMYDQIGNTSSVNAGMELAIRSIESMMRNWKTTARVLDSVAVATTVYIVGLKNAAIASKALTSAVALENLAHQQQIIRTPKIIAGIIGINNAKKISTLLTNLHTKAVLSEAAATNVLTKGFWKLTAAMLANPWVAAASAITLVGVALFHFIGNTETAAERAEKLNNSVASLKNLDDTTKPLIDTYNELINKTERTAEEQKKLSEVTHELAKQYPGAITAIGNFGTEVELAADKLNKLYQTEKQARMDNTRHELEKTEQKITETEEKIARLQAQLQDGTKTVTVGSSITGYTQTITVQMSDEDKGKILKQIDELRYGEDGQSGLFGLQQSAEAARRALGLIPSEAAQAVEKFGAWKKTFTTFRQQVGNVRVQLFDDSTINQFGSLEEALKKTAEEYKKNIALVATYDETLKSATLTSEERAKIETERAEADAMANLAEKALKYYNAMSLLNTSTSSRSGSKSDPRLQTLQEIANKMAEVNKEYDDLLKKEGQTKALADTQKLFASSFKQMEAVAKKYKFKLPAFEVPQTIEDVQRWYKAIMDNIKRLNLKNADKVLIELGFKSDKAAIDKQQKDIEKQLQELADRISRTKTAKEFYEKILGQTGNRDMAKRLVTSIFGENGSALNKEIAERMRKMVEGTSATLPDFVFNADMSVNSKALRGWVEANKAALGDVAKELTKFADDAEKDTAKMVEGWLKATEKAKTYGDKLADVYRTTATEIARIEAEMAKGNLGRDIGTELIAGYRRKEAEEVAKLQYEAFKDSPMYVQMFDDLDHASTRMLENMKSRLENLQGAWRNLDPTQLKEMQSRLREIDEQLAKRNPFKVMADGLREYTRLRTKGDARGNTSRANADRDATEWAEKYLEAQEELAKITSDPTATEAQIAGARQMVDYTKRQKDEAEKTAANWKKVEDAIGLSANQLMQMLNWGGDIAHAIADISEAMGADEEDVQYWNDIASGLDEVSGAIQDIVSAAMSANVVGVISSALTAIPKMFVGFANIFSAGKVKRANKEIKRQQELIEALEYSYSRLEKAAEKTFGADYLRNVNERLRMLKAEAEAYRKQAEAERSKGKKRDKEAEKEYLEHARDTADEIEELNRELQEKITGTTVEKAAEDFANAWLDAYLSFGNTAEAIKEKFRDMMKTMVVNMALSGVVDRMLKPLMDMIDERAADRELSSREIAEIMGAVPGYVDDIDNAMTVAMEALKAAGVDVGQLRDAADAETRGIAKGVASATSEEINAATAVGKTLLYYASPIPRIDENLARVVAIMESRGIASPTASGTTTGAVDYTGMFNTANQHLSSLPRMEQHLAEIHTMLGRALKTKGSTTGFNTFLN